MRYFRIRTYSRIINYIIVCNFKQKCNKLKSDARSDARNISTLVTTFKEYIKEYKYSLSNHVDLTLAFLTLTE